MYEIKTFSESLQSVTAPIIFGVVEKNSKVHVPTCPELNAFAQSAGACGKKGESLRSATPNGFLAPFVIFVGLGDLSGSKNILCELREAGGNGGRLVKHQEVYLSMPLESSKQLNAVLEGVALGSYRFERYLKDKTAELKTIWIPDKLSPSEQDMQHCQVLVRAVNDIRDLVNTSPSQLYPETLSKWMEKAAKKLGITVEKWDYKALRQGGFGGMEAVGKGSKRKPVLLKLAYEPENAKAHVALVGKGITFDTGGYSLKPPSSMTTMKADMTGAATVGNTVLAAAQLKLPVKVTAWLCMAENMVSGKASHVDDVIIMKNGSSVEINNTDAEGRLVLADGLAMAVSEQPDLVIDVATLTGAQVVALGGRTAGVMGCEKERYCEAAKQAGEMAWPCPLPEHLAEDLKSDVADIRNAGTKREGGMCQAGLFLQNFVSSYPWVHVDIAGPGFNTGSAWGYTPKGGTGYGLRTLINLLENLAD